MEADEDGVVLKKDVVVALKGMICHNLLCWEEVLLLQLGVDTMM